MSNIYIYAEEMAFETLHLETRQIKSDINLQFVSDQENLTTMAFLAAKLYENGESFDIMLNSFKAIGLIEEIGILTQDNMFMTRIGTFESPEGLDFETEIMKGAYVSEKTKDVTTSNREVIRNAVPVKVNGKSIAMLYGIIDLGTLKNRYIDDATSIGAHLIVVESATGNYVINTRRNKLGNITSLAPVEFDENYSYRNLVKDIKAGQSGFTAFVPQGENELCYAHYAPTAVGDWQIMLVMPQNIVLGSTHKTQNYMILMFTLIVLVMFLYILFIFASDRRRLKISVYASMVRKRLLEVNNQLESFSYALESVANFAKARSVFFVDTYGEDYRYVSPAYRKISMEGEDKKYFILKLLQYASGNRKENRTDVYVTKIVADAKLAADYPDLCNFMDEHGIENVCFAVIMTNTASMSLLGVVNTKNRYVDKLLKDISVCFSMAIYNKKHLIRTESMAITDSLTNVQNRMAYNQDLKELKHKNNVNLACIYIDVNELHYFNNHYGHASGDQMLVFIAETLKYEFGERYIYRMGGDEFLIFAENLTDETLNVKVDSAVRKIEEMKYHIAIGIKRGDKTKDIEEIVSLAEKEMYENKAKYYQAKNKEKFANTTRESIRTISTGVKEVDTCLSIMSKRYHGAYSVDLDADMASQIMAPSSYFEMDGTKEKYSEIFREYIHDVAKPEFYRTLLQLLDYDVLKRQLEDGDSPRVSYVKVDGERVSLTISSIPGEDHSKTIWLFEREDN